MSRLIELTGNLGIDRSGKLKLVTGGLKAQTTQALENLKHDLETKGLNFEEITGLDFYITSDIGFEEIFQVKSRMNKVCSDIEKAYIQFLSKNLSRFNKNYRPTRTLIEIDVLPSIEQGLILFGRQIPRVEIIARAIKRGKNKGYHKTLEEIEGVSHPERNSSQAIVVDLGKELYFETAGILPREPAPSREGIISDFYRHMRQPFENIKLLLEQVSGKPEDVTRMDIYLSNFDKSDPSFWFVENTYKSFFAGPSTEERNRLDYSHVNVRKVKSIPKKARYYDRYGAEIMVTCQATVPKAKIRERETERKRLMEVDY